MNYEKNSRLPKFHFVLLDTSGDSLTIIHSIFK